MRGRISGADKRFFPCRQGKDCDGVAAIDAAARQDARDPAADLRDGSHDYLARANSQIDEFASASAKAMKRAITTSWSGTQPIDIGTRYYRAPFPAIRYLGPIRRVTRRAECPVLPAPRDKRGRSTEDIRMTHAPAPEIE